MSDEVVTLRPYDPAWPAMFAREAEALTAVLGPWITGGVHHVGSTAVPGLPAKPIVDIMVGVADLQSSRPCLDLVAGLDYCYAPHRPEVMHWFCKPDPSRRTHHLQLVPFGSARFADVLAFRDYLRAHPSVADAYARLKGDLAVRHHRDREAYTQGKSAMVARRGPRTPGGGWPATPLPRKVDLVDVRVPPDFCRGVLVEHWHRRTNDGGVMAVRAAAVRGLSEQDVAAIRDQLAAGRRPRVMFTEAAGQVVGQIGQVVSLADPAASAEFVVVRFGKDELPFSPGDVQIAPRGAVAKKPAPPAPEPVRPAEPEFLIDKPLPVKAAPPPVPAPAAPAPSVPAPSVPAPRKAAAARAGKPKPPAGLTVTLAYADGEWTVAAMQGSKALARPYVVRPAEALRMVGLVDVPGVREAVEQILASERAEAQAQADRLRAELAEVEARLAELPDLP